MSKVSLEQFVEHVSASEELKVRIGEEITTDSLIALGAENGFVFTVEDFRESIFGTISDEEFALAGGGFGLRPIGTDANYWNIFWVPSRDVCFVEEFGTN